MILPLRLRYWALQDDGASVRRTITGTPRFDGTTLTVTKDAKADAIEVAIVRQADVISLAAPTADDFRAHAEAADFRPIVWSDLDQIVPTNPKETTP